MLERKKNHKRKKLINYFVKICMPSSGHLTIDVLHLFPWWRENAYKQYNFHSFLFFSVERWNFEVVQKVYIIILNMIFGIYTRCQNRVSERYTF